MATILHDLSLQFSAENEGSTNLARALEAVSAGTSVMALEAALQALLDAPPPPLADDILIGGQACADWLGLANRRKFYGLKAKNKYLKTFKLCGEVCMLKSVTMKFILGQLVWGTANGDPRPLRIH